MLRNASIVCNGSMTQTDVIFQAQHFDFMLAPGAITHAVSAKKLAFAYGQPTHRENTWTQWLDDYGWKQWIMENKNDGLLVDTPFEYYDIVRLDDIAAQIAPYPFCPNYGDFGTWTRKAPAAPGYGPMAEELEKHFQWAYVQNALDMQFFSEAKWRDLRSAANVRLSAGKTLILGIYDPGRKNEQLCALLTHSFEHPQLIWQYCTDMTSLDPATNWNNEWKWAR